MRRVHIIGMGKANVRLRLAQGTRLKTLLGERTVTELYIGLNEPGKFVQALGGCDARPSVGGRD